MHEHDAGPVGQVYVDARLPRHRWRVVRQNGEIFTLERTDKPTVFRFVDQKTLDDPTRYLRSR